MGFREQIVNKPHRLLALAAVFHLLLTVTIVFVGKRQLLPTMFDQNGTAFSTVADGTSLLKDAIGLAKSIRSGDFSYWLYESYSFHVKIYAVSFALLVPLIGENVLCAEPLNLLYYLGMLILVFKLAQQIFNSTAGLIAASIVAVWPSLLLHSTQMTKDSLFICEMLLLVLALVRLLLLTHSDRRWLIDALAGSVASVLLWKTRSDFAALVLESLALTGLLLTIRFFSEKKILTRNALALVMILAVTLTAMVSLRVYRISDHPRVGLRHPSQPSSVRWWQVAARIGKIRDGFIKEYRLSGSNVGSDIRITNFHDLVTFFPRATAVGLFAPFPSMWFESGTPTGPLARKVSGAETLALYLIEIISAVGFWRGRRNLANWLLVSIATSGIVLLGLAVINVGALFRQRYFFVILLIVLAASQLDYWFGKNGTRSQLAE